MAEHKSERTGILSDSRVQREEIVQSWLDSRSLAWNSSKSKSIRKTPARIPSAGSRSRVHVITHPEYIRPTYHDSITYTSTMQESCQMANIFKVTMLDRLKQTDMDKHRLAFGTDGDA